VKCENEPKMELLLGAKRILHHRDTEAQRSERKGSVCLPQVALATGPAALDNLTEHPLT
jgi:hypothetical protein